MRTDEPKLSLSIFPYILIAVLVLISNIVLYYKLTTDYNNKLNLLNQKVDTVQDSLVTAIAKERTNNIKQLSSLENKTLSNFKKLQDFFSSETTKLKLDVENVKTQTSSELQGISEKVGGLEDKISELHVTSSDFSSIIEDAVKAVVSVKTNLGQGSGVIFNSDGYVMTNKHVISGAVRINVVDYDSNVYSVRLIGTAKDADLAVLKIDSNKTFNYLNFADSSSIKLGERVIAVGNPLGLSFTVTEGIISGVDRVIDVSKVPYIQTDVSINPGNSGGPLINSQKEIVGINTFKIINTEGLGFAIPSSVAQGIADQALS